jgi:hypothetical protein
MTTNGLLSYPTKNRMVCHTSVSYYNPGFISESDYINGPETSSAFNKNILRAETPPGAPALSFL